ncbi:MAG: rhodanese-related sulfurtransferase [Leptolyngbya sp. SIO4C1]|nr:rhodanese-related sulfurtransferase [Leptolyngbya sp. SIO4C1]
MRHLSMYGHPERIEQIDVETFAQRLLTEGETLQLIDVREPQEVAIAALPNFIHLPLSEYIDWADKILIELDPAIETIVICHHGMRSAQMCQWLLRQGFQNVKNLIGGIDAYAVAVDPSIPRY